MTNCLTFTNYNVSIINYMTNDVMIRILCLFLKRIKNTSFLIFKKKFSSLKNIFILCV